MFTGIIKVIGRVTSTIKTPKGLTLTIAIADQNLREIVIGDSIAINGVCSTVTSTKKGLTFFYMPESLKKTALGSLSIGDQVNMERSMTLNERLNGHMMQGHVDTTGVITSIEPDGDSFVITIRVISPQRYMRYLAPKGSIAVDGISLTVVNVSKTSFTVHIIPYTIQHTNLGARAKRDLVNLEFDMLAKYLERLTSAHMKRFDRSARTSHDISKQTARSKKTSDMYERL